MIICDAAVDDAGFINSSTDYIASYSFIRRHVGVSLSLSISCLL